jgi:hypothetical protein
VEAHLAGNYAGATFLLPDGSIDALTTTFVELNADGAGRFSTVAAAGQSSNQKNLTTRQAIPPALYSLRTYGGGSITFVDSATLFGGSRQIFVSPGGEILLGFSPDQGRREILVAVRRLTPVVIADWSGNWWINELLADNEIAGAVRLESSLGDLEPDGSGSVRLWQRLSASEPWRDVTAVNYAGWRRSAWSVPRGWKIQSGDRIDRVCERRSGRCRIESSSAWIVVRGACVPGARFRGAQCCVARSGCGAAIIRGTIHAQGRWTGKRRGERARDHQRNAERAYRSYARSN